MNDRCAICIVKGVDDCAHVYQCPVGCGRMHACYYPKVCDQPTFESERRSHFATGWALLAYAIRYGLIVERCRMTPGRCFCGVHIAVLMKHAPTDGG